MLDRYYSGTLLADENYIYSKIYSMLSRGVRYICLTQTPSEKVFEVLQLEHPELYYVNLHSITVESRSGENILHFDYYIDHQQIKAIEVKTAQIAGSLKGDTEYTIRSAHNYLVKNVAYDHESAKSNKYDYITHSIIGPFVYKRAVCEGIALAFKRLLDLKGVDNAVVIGKFRGDNSNIYHMWNVVYINGEKYYIDVTQDIISTDKRWGKPSYLYYMLTEEELLKTHVPEELFGCHGVRDNPFDKTGKSFNSLREVKRYIHGIPESQRLIYLKCKCVSSKEISATVADCLSRDGNYRRISITENAGRYYIFKEK